VAMETNKRQRIFSIKNWVLLVRDLYEILIFTKEYERKDVLKFFFW